MNYPVCYEKRIIINSRDVDGYGHCRASAVLAYLQDASAEHSQICGCSRKDMMDHYNTFWMLTRVYVKLNRPLLWLDELTIKTWHRGGKNVLLYRDYDLYVGNELIGEAVALWVLPDFNSRKLLNLSKVSVPGIVHSTNFGAAKDIKLNALREKQEPQIIAEHTLAYSETDVNGHINNTKYADFCFDALRFHNRKPELYWQEIEITYHAESNPGDKMNLRISRSDGQYLICGMTEDEIVRFNARICLNLESGE